MRKKRQKWRTKLRDGVSSSLGQIPGSKDQLLESDLEALDDFCSEVQLDEIDFEQFKEVSKCLDLYTEVYVSRESMLEGGRKEVSLSRRVRQGGVKNWKPQRFKVLVCWAKFTQDGSSLTYKDLGDWDNDRKGNLKVTIYLRK